MNILILDDHPIVRQGIIAILNTDKDASHKYYEAGTIKEAMKILEYETIETVFVDLNLGSENGFDFIRRAKVKYNNQKYLIITSSTKYSDWDKAQALDIDGYIIKDAFAEDIIYALAMIRRNKKFIPSIIMEQFKSNHLINEEILTKREQEVFSLLKKGKTNAEISEDLIIAQATTKKHVSNILTKLDLRHRVEVALYANKS